MHWTACTFALALGLAPAIPGQSELSVAEREAFRLKGQGRYRQARDAFLTLLDETVARGGDRRAAARAEFYATAATALKELAPIDGELRGRLAKAATAPLLRRHRIVADRVSLLLLAQALATGDATAVREYTGELGFLQEWRFIGPFDNERGTGWDRVHGPERELDLDAPLPGKRVPVTWQPLPLSVLPAGKVNLDALVRPNDQVLCYAATCLVSEQERDAALYLGSGGAYKVFLNGAEIGRNRAARTWRPDQDGWPIRLAAGANLLVVKICDQDRDLVFSTRLRALNGAPLPVRVTAATDDLRRAAKTAAVPAPQGAVDLGARSTFAQAAVEDPVARFHLVWLQWLTRTEDETTDELVARIERVVTDLPGFPEARMLLAQARIRPAAHSADVDDNPRRRDLEAVLAMAPDHVEATLALARLQLRRLDAVANAEELARGALMRTPTSAAARAMLAEVLTARGLPELSRRQIRDAGATDAPLSARRRLGRMLEELDDLSGAQVVWNGILADAPSPPHLLAAGALELRRGQRERAEELWRRTIALDPFARVPRLRLAGLYEAAGDVQGALEVLVEWLRLCPDDDRVLVAVAELHGRLGDRDRQREALRAALERNPNLRNEQRYLQFLEADERPFYGPYRIPADDVLAADPGPPSDAATANDPYYYLLRNRVVRAHRNGTTSEYGHLIVRVLTEQGARRLQQFAVPHYPGEESARLLSARVLRADGSVRTPKLRGAYLALPALSPGDAVDLEYRIDDLSPTFFGDYFGLEHSFAAPDGAPLHRSALAVLLDPGRDYRFQSVRGAPEPERTALPDGVTVCRYTMRELPRRVTEPGAPPARERQPVARITTFADWDHFATWWWNLIEKQIDTSPPIRAKVAELTAGLTSEREKIDVIYGFVTTEIRYEAWEFGVHGYKPYSAPVIFERRHGDCKDKAVLLTAMLGELGIAAYPVLIHADPERSLDDLTLPLISHFNHCISHVPAAGGEGGLFLDGTATWHPSDTLPEMDQGAEVLVVRGEHAELRSVAWTTPESNRDVREHTIELSADGSALVTLALRPTGNAAVALREELGNEPGRRRESFERRMSRRFGEVSLRDLAASDPLDLAQQVQVTLSLSVPRFAEPRDGRMLLRSSLANGRLLSLAAETERRTALVLGTPELDRDVVAYRLPPGWSPVQLPEPVQMETSFGSFSLKCRRDAREVVIERELRWRVPRIEPEEYPAFREFVTAIAEADDRRLVLQKDEERR